jgi:hypothetical protein
MSYAVAFTDEEIGVVLDAARQLDLDDRDAFLVAVTDALRSAARAGD